MRIIRYFHVFSCPDVLDKEITKEQEKSFDEILQEEKDRLIQLISEVQGNEDIGQLYLEYNPRTTDHIFPEE
jgi:hypothetical protein